MSEAEIIEFPEPNWVKELASLYTTAGEQSTAEMIFDLYNGMRRNPSQYSAEKIYEIINKRYALPGNNQTRRNIGNAAIVYLPWIRY